MIGESSDWIAQNLREIEERVEQARASGDHGAEAVKLLAVSKRKPISVVQAAISSGQRIFSENYVQEARQKIEMLEQEQGFARVANPKPVLKFGAEAVRFDLTGPLQRNKVGHAVELFDVIQTVDRIELAEEISSQALKRGFVQDILVQVNISGEESKSGISEDGAAELCANLLELPGISLKGLMSIGAYVPDSKPIEERKEQFVKMRELKLSIESALGVGLDELSMGMSHDFELAVEEGATIVRVGEAIFGAR